MKKRNLKVLSLNKKSISLLNMKGGANGDTSNTDNHLTADIKDCPDNTLAFDCHSLGYCFDSNFCNQSEVVRGSCWTLCFDC